MNISKTRNLLSNFTLPQFNLKQIQMVKCLFLSMLVAISAQYLEEKLSVQWAGASVIALLLGMGVNNVGVNADVKAGLKSTSKKILELATILLGATLNLNTIFSVGKLSIVVLISTLITCFGGGYLLGKWLKLNWKLTHLLSAGTAICGGTAIATIAPVIEAEDNDIAYALSGTFIFDMILIILFPILGSFLALSDVAYGIWVGSTVGNTSSVIAAGYAYSDVAGELSAMVKMTRTLAIIPITIASATYLQVQKKKQGIEFESTTQRKVNFFPTFILGFLLFATLNTFGLLPVFFVSHAKEGSKFLMVLALAAVGMNTDFKALKTAGLAPMVHAFSVTTLVILVAFLVESAIGLV